MKRSMIVLCAAALAAGCSADEKADREGVAQYAEDLGTSAGSASASASAGGAKAVAESNDVWEFQFAYPAAVGRIAPLAAMLDARQVKALEDLKAQAIEGRATADEQGFPFNPYSLQVGWNTVTDLPGWLSLSSEFYTYTGGAHGNSGFEGLLWDKQANVSRKPESLFLSLAALEGAVKPAFCEALNKQRAEKRQEPIPAPADADDWANACPGIGETTVILGSSNSRTFDRIGFLIGPYVAGPYAEGSYEVTLPVTKAVKGAVKPEFAASFTAVR
jgi:hypothetical protein